MNRAFGIVLFATLGAGTLSAQLNILTLRESELLIERISQVVAAQNRGDCPTLSPNYDGPENIWFQVRRACGPNGGELIGNYTINRRTGAVTTWGDNPRSVLDAQGRMVATQMLAEAEKRILSSAEAQCLALEAAKALPGWAGEDSNVIVSIFGKPDTSANTVQFIANRASRSRPVESGRMLTVFLAEARVRDDQTGVEVMSPNVGNIVAKLMEIRTPQWLSDEDAASVALVVPRVVMNLRDGCKLVAGGAFYSAEALIGVTCKDVEVPESNVLVSLQTGMVADPEKRTSLDTAQSRAVAQQLLGRIPARRVKLQEEIEAACRP